MSEVGGSREREVLANEHIVEESRANVPGSASFRATMARGGAGVSSGGAGARDAGPREPFLSRPAPFQSGRRTRCEVRVDRAPVSNLLLVRGGRDERGARRIAVVASQRGGEGEGGGRHRYGRGRYTRHTGRCSMWLLGILLPPMCFVSRKPKRHTPYPGLSGGNTRGVGVHPAI